MVTVARGQSEPVVVLDFETVSDQCSSTGVHVDTSGEVQILMGPQTSGGGG